MAEPPSNTTEPFAPLAPRSASPVADTTLAPFAPATSTVSKALAYKGHRHREKSGGGA